MEEGHLCGDQLVLYLGCSSGYTDVHMGQNGIKLYKHIVPRPISGYDIIL